MRKRKIAFILGISAMSGCSATDQQVLSSLMTGLAGQANGTPYRPAPIQPVAYKPSVTYAPVEGTLPTSSRTTGQGCAELGELYNHICGTR